MKLTLQRIWPLKTCVVGQLLIDGEFFNYTLERPDLGNAPGISCIPVGTYKLELKLSPHRGYRVPWLIDVPNRSSIEIHIANYPYQLEGCIAVGDTKGPDYVGGSKLAFERLMRKLDGQKDLSIQVQNV